MSDPVHKPEKRAPTTPLAPSKSQNKRKFAPKFDLRTPSVLDTLTSESNYQRELLEARYKIWLLEKEVENQRDVNLFLELERACGET